MRKLIKFIPPVLIGSSMARKRRGRKTQRRRRSQGINLVNAGELYLQTAVLTRGLGGVNPLSFFTGVEAFNKQTGTGTGQKGQAVPMYSSAISYGYNPTGASLTVPELFGAGSANAQQAQAQLIQNFKDNWFSMAVQTIGVRAGFAIGKKLLSKQRTFVNKGLKMTGIGSMVKV